MVALQKVLNIDKLENDFDSFRNKRFKIEVPALHIEKQIELTNFDKLRKDIFELSKQFPHRRVALTYKNDGETIFLEIHPITGAA